MLDEDIHEKTGLQMILQLLFRFICADATTHIVLKLQKIIERQTLRRHSAQRGENGHIKPVVIYDTYVPAQRQPAWNPEATVPSCCCPPSRWWRYPEGPRGHVQKALAKTFHQFHRTSK